jgi:acetoin utilization deacetylase AcuC-like enzyme
LSSPALIGTVEGHRARSREVLYGEVPMVTLFTDPRMRDHVPPRGHPERPERLDAVLRHLARTGIAHTCPAGMVRPATDAEILRVHTRGHLENLERHAGVGGQVEADTWMSPGSFESARLAAGAAVEAVNAVVEGKARRAACLVRPPGHHALADSPMGFCLLANVAIGAAQALEVFELNRILIVDFDVHHGNGTQALFYDNPQVGFFSIHRYPFYPGTGASDETGTGRALGTTLNVPLPYETSRHDYRAAFENGLSRFADQIRPELVIVSAGFDAHAEDPVGDLGLEVEDFIDLTRLVAQVAETHADGRIVSVLEGGYNVPILAGCVAAHLEALGAEPLPPGSR